MNNSDPAVAMLMSVRNGMMPATGVTWAALRPFGVGALMDLGQKSGIQVDGIPSTPLGPDTAGDAWGMSRRLLARSCECDFPGRSTLELQLADEARKPEGEGICLFLGEQVTRPWWHSRCRFIPEARGLWPLGPPWFRVRRSAGCRRPAGVRPFSDGRFPDGLRGVEWVSLLYKVECRQRDPAGRGTGGGCGCQGRNVAGYPDCLECPRVSAEPGDGNISPVGAVPFPQNAEGTVRLAG